MTGISKYSNLSYFTTKPASNQNIDQSSPKHEHEPFHLDLRGGSSYHCTSKGDNAGDGPGT